MGAVRRRVVVRGQVQGVFFRDSVARLAADRNVSGWVANRQDGSVEAAFEGNDDDVAALVDFCRGGPSRADVEDIETSDEPPEGLSGFEVR